MRFRHSLIRSVIVALLAGVVLAGCGTGNSNPYPISTPLPLPTYTITFLAHTPGDTPAGDTVILNILDEVTGLTLNPTSYSMKQVDTNLWQTALDFPRNALVNYRYSLTSGEIEAASGPGMVDYRTYYASGNNQVEDSVAHWLGTDFHGTTGRILGLVRDGVSGLAIPGLMVDAGGMRTQTASDGSYLLSGVPTGKQTLVAFDMDGNYRPFIQEAIVADGQDTPANLLLSPAPHVTISFHLYVPKSETPAGAQIRLDGNLLSMGNTFEPGAASTMVEPARAPLMTVLNDGTYIASLSLPVGTYVRYKFTLGDGFWNAERDSQGRLVLHDMIVPEHDTIVENGVLTWRSGKGGPVTFNAVTPPSTPASDKLFIQFSPFQGIWMRPIPMWMIGPQQWTYTLESPLEWPGPVAYRYCRNGMCGLADDLATAGDQATGRQFQVSSTPQSVVDTVLGWTDWPDTSSAVVPAPSAAVRSGLRFGVMFSPTLWSPPYDPTLADLGFLDTLRLSEFDPSVSRNGFPQPAVVSGRERSRPGNPLPAGTGFSAPVGYRLSTGKPARDWNSAGARADRRRAVGIDVGLVGYRAARRCLVGCVLQRLLEPSVHLRGHRPAERRGRVGDRPIGDFPGHAGQSANAGGH